MPVEESGPNPVIPNVGELIIGLLTFAIVVFVLMKYAWPRMEATFQVRRDAIEGGIKRAEEAQAEAQRLLGEYRQQLSEARTEAAQIRDNARAEGQQIIEEMRTTAQEESARIVARGEEQLTVQRQQVVRELRGEIGTLATGLAERVVGETLADDPARQRTIDRFLDDLDLMAQSVPAGVAAAGAAGAGAAGGSAAATGGSEAVARAAPAVPAPAPAASAGGGSGGGASRWRCAGGGASGGGSSGAGGGRVRWRRVRRRCRRGGPASGGGPVGPAAPAGPVASGGSGVRRDGRRTAAGPGRTTPAAAAVAGVPAAAGDDRPRGGQPGDPGRRDHALDGIIDRSRAEELGPLADQLFAVTELLDREAGLRRALADPAADPDRRQGLFDRLLGSQLDAQALELLRPLVRERWSGPARPGRRGPGAQPPGRARHRRARRQPRRRRGPAVPVRPDPRGRAAAAARAGGPAGARRPQGRAAGPAGRRPGRRTTRQLLEHAVRAPRGHGLERAVTELVELAAARRERYVAYVTAPAPLTDQQEGRLTAALARVYGRQISLQVTVDPAAARRPGRTGERRGHRRQRGVPAGRDPAADDRVGAAVMRAFRAGRRHWDH